MLSDGRQITGNPTVFERFLYGTFAACATLEVLHTHNLKLKLAYVIHEPLHDSERFGGNVATNRGMEVKTFEDMNEAVQWLQNEKLEAGTSPERPAAPTATLTSAAVLQLHC